MKISYNWLKQFLNVNLNVEESGILLTDLGLEVEGITPFSSVKGGLKGVVVGKVLTCEKHPNADKLKVTTVNVGGEEPLQIVCGAPNVAAGQTVPVALINTELYDKDGNAFKIKKGKIRGELSYGMICAEDELGLGESHDGILVLDDKFQAGTPLADAFDIESDQVFEIGLTPNRSDAMSHFGVARDLRAGLIQKGTQLELISPSVSNYQVDERISQFDIDIENKKLAPRYCGVTLSNVKVGPSPKWLQNRLTSIGVKCINNVVDITNYVLHELGQPLHAFDAGKIPSNTIRVKKLAANTPFTTLDGVERKLHQDDLMICDGDDKPLCIAGVLGGLDSGVSEQTHTVFLESAYFDAVSVRKTAKRHTINSDASFRFERGIDPNLTKYALKRAVLLIKEICGAKVTSEITDLYPEKIEDSEILLTYANVNKLIGQEISKDIIKNILASLEIKIMHETENGLGLIVPSYRVDVTREADIVEEILRVYGFNNIEFSHKLNTSISYDKDLFYPLEQKVSQYLCAQGFFEIMSNSLTKPYNFPKDLVEADKKVVQMMNPLSSDLSVMRQTMLFSGLESLSHNIKHKNNNCKFFEFGKTYHKVADDFVEDKHLSLFLTGDLYQSNWKAAKMPSDFFYLKSIVIGLLKRLGIDDYKIEPTNKSWIEGLQFEVRQKPLLVVGQISKTLCDQTEIKQAVYGADIDLSLLAKLTDTPKKQFKEWVKFPEVKRDLALLVDDQIKYKDLHDTALKSERKLLKAVDLFDVYEGKKLPEGKKSYALSFVLQDASKTLNDKQIDKVMQKILKTFEREFNVSLRS